MKAYINVSNKENLDILIKNLKANNFEIIENIKNVDMENIDLVAINFDTFEEYIDKDIDLETILENIDIENVSILRKASKNYEKTIVLTDNNDFNIDLDDISLEKREELALKAFLKTSKYDFLINKKLSKEFQINNQNKAFYFDKIQDLKYGENPHQKASLYNFNKKLDWNLLNGNELSYNDILDASCAIEIIAEFFDVNACAIVKHENPNAVALSHDIENAFDKAIDSDPTSALNGIVAFSKEIDLSLAKKLKLMQLKMIIAPSFNNEALIELKKDKFLKIVQINTDLKEILNFNDEEIKLTPFGALIQDKDTKDLDVSTFRVITKKKPEQKEVEDMIFAFKIAKHVKSSGVVVAKDLRTLGISASETTEASAIEYALAKVCDSPKDSVVASDGIFNTIDNIQIMAQNRVSGAIQVGGSLNDDKVIECADKLNVSMISTGIRHYKH